MPLGVRKFHLERLAPNKKRKVDPFGQYLQHQSETTHDVDEHGLVNGEYVSSHEEKKKVVIQKMEAQTKPFAPVDPEGTSPFDDEVKKNLFSKTLNIGGYLMNKVHHTDLQFQNDASSIASNTNPIFRGVEVHVNGQTKPSKELNPVLLY